MSAGEFVFLALGLVLGVIVGAALIVFLRGRAPSPEVRLTVTPDSVPRRRPTTLAEDAFSMRAEVARGGPADYPAETSRQPAAIAIQPEPDDQMLALRGLVAAAAEPATVPQPLTAMALLSGGRKVGSSITGGPPAEGPPPRPTGQVRGATETPSDQGAGASAAPQASPSSSPSSPRSTEDCLEVRRVADERCSLAGRARAQAVATHEALSEAQRAYDDHQARAEKAAERADPRTIRSAKDAAQQAFRSARAASSTPEAVEAAARDWLSEINRINRLSREAAATADREREAAATMVPGIERLSLDADAARISAETAEAACLAARHAAAECTEAVGAGTPPSRPGPGASAPAPEPVEEGAGSRALMTEAVDAAILRMLRGDRRTLAAIVSGLAGRHPEDVRHWRLLLTTLVDVILARAIEAACLVYPAEHPFWGPFTRAQNRDVTSALASLGYRFDGLGGWVDDRMPGQRDLAMAVGYAGLDPMRVRHWPTEAETAELFRDVRVAGDEYLVETAGDLTLGQLVTLLGPRADELAELWNDWSRVRPLLLSD